MIRLATVQSVIGVDVHANGAHVRGIMVQAARQGARMVHFPEGGLSGYILSEIDDWDQADWAGLEEELQATAALARQLGLWVVIGANHRMPRPLWPQNSLYVISDQGELAGRYNKRLCSNTELTYWYTPGTEPLSFEVDGTRFGCALCIEVVFPHLFAEYERLGVDCVLLSSYSNDPAHGIMARGHAATTCMWISLSTPAACTSLNAMLIGPDGNPAAQCPPGQPGLLIQAIDRMDERYRLPLRVARPWRTQARAGRIYAGRAVP